MTTNVVINLLIPMCAHSESVHDKTRLPKYVMLKSVGSAALISALSATLVACASPIPFQGTTTAGEMLRADVANSLTGRAKFLANCNAPVDKIQTEVLRTHPPGSAGSSAAAKNYGSVDERWTLSLCGKNLPFAVTFTPDGQGGTFFRTTNETVSNASWKPFRVTGEQIEHPVPTGWKLAWMEGNPDSSYYAEYLPEGESIEHWRTGYLLLSRVPLPSAEVLAKVEGGKNKLADGSVIDFFQKASKACAGTNELMSQRTNVFNGIYMAVGGGFCDRYGATAPFGEGALVAFAVGKDYLFKMQYGWRPANEQQAKANLPWRLDAELARQYLEAFKASTLCGGTEQPACKPRPTQP